MLPLTSRPISGWRVGRVLCATLVLLSLSWLTPAPVTAGPPRSAPAAVTLATGAEERRLAVWNYEFEDGRDDMAPLDWKVTPASPRAALKAVRQAAPPAFPQYTTQYTVNHVVWLWDKTASGGVAVRARALNATAGRRYTAIARVLVGSGAGARLNLEFLDARGVRLPSRGLVGQSTRPPAVGALTWVKAQGVAPAGTTTVRPIHVSSYATVGSSYWDLVYLDETVPKEVYSNRLGTGQVLFVGDHRVQSRTGLSRVLHPGSKHRVAGDPRMATPVYDAVCCIKDGQPPHSSQMSGTVLYEDGVYKMWYTAKAPGLPWSVRYSESDDGNSFPGGVQVLSDVWSGGVVRNPNTTDPRRKYLMLGVKGSMAALTAPPMPQINVTYRAYASPDGRTWTSISASPVLPMRDVVNVSYDRWARRFVATTKQASGNGRQVFLSYSTDFVHWTTARQVMASDASDPASSSIYGMPVFRHGDQLLGIPQIYTIGVLDGVDGPIEPQITSSTDGVHWSRLARAPLVPLGSSGELDRGIIVTANAPVVVGDQMRLYYGGWNAGHETTKRNARIFYAQWRIDGFVSMRAGSGGGTLTTKALLLTGKNLTVNADLAAGRIRAEVYDAVSNTIIPGYDLASSSVLTGDTLAGSLTWGGKSIGALGSRQVKIRFSISAGHLYSFRVS